MRRIAYVINYIVKGGPSAVVMNMIHNLDRTRFEPVLITLFEGNDPRIIVNEKKQGSKLLSVIIKTVCNSCSMVFLSIKKSWKNIKLISYMAMDLSLTS